MLLHGGSELPGWTEITCPQDLFVRCVPQTGTVVNYTATVTNRCTNIALSFDCFPASGSVFLPGTTTVCCRAIDANNETNQCCFRVTVTADDIPPTIICPSNIIVTSQNCAPMDVLYPHPTATDNCQLDSVICRPPTDSLFPVGTTTVLCCATDKAGNSNCCPFTVTVRCPSNDCVRIVCPANFTNNCAHSTGGIVSYDAYAPGHPYTGGVLPVSCSIPSGSSFPLGTTTVCCTNVFNGTVSVCCFTVTVRPDIIPPVINCPSNIVVISQDCKPIDVQYPQPGATDNCQLSGVFCAPPSGSAFPVGTTSVTCCARDYAGHTNCCSFTVTVRCPPNDCVRVVCPTNLVVDCGTPNGQVVAYSAYATNLCTGGAAPLTCHPPSGSNFPLGTTTVCCTNVTGGVVNWCCFEVTVNRDVAPPVIDCPYDIAVISPNCAPVPVQYPPPTASDNCQLAGVTCTPPSGSPFPVGVTTVTCCARDAAGNSNCCSFKVTVRCPPNDCIRVICPSNIVMDCASPNGAVVTYNAYATNFCTGGVGTDRPAHRRRGAIS